MNKFKNIDKAEIKTDVSVSIDVFTYIKTMSQDFTEIIRRVNITNSDKKDIASYKKYVRKVFPQYHSFSELSNEKLDCLYDV